MRMIFPRYACYLWRYRDEYTSKYLKLDAVGGK